MFLPLCEAAVRGRAGSIDQPQSLWTLGSVSGLGCVLPSLPVTFREQQRQRRWPSQPPSFPPAVASQRAEPGASLQGRESEMPEPI